MQQVSYLYKNCFAPYSAHVKMQKSVWDTKNTKSVTLQSQILWSALFGSRFLLDDILRNFFPSSKISHFAVCASLAFCCAGVDWLEILLSGNSFPTNLCESNRECTGHQCRFDPRQPADVLKASPKWAAYIICSVPQEKRVLWTIVERKA